MINAAIKVTRAYVKTYFGVAALLMIFIGVQSAWGANTSRDEYFYDSRTDQPYRSPYNSGSLYSDGGTEDRAASDARRLQGNHESHARSRSFGSYGVRSGGQWCVDGKSVFRHDRGSYGR